MDYARVRAQKILASLRSAVLATSGPAGIRASRADCEAVGVFLYLLLPVTSDHLFNLEADPSVALAVEGWEVRGLAFVVSPERQKATLGLLAQPDALFQALVEVRVSSLHSRSGTGWSAPETIDVEPDAQASEAEAPRTGGDSGEAGKLVDERKGERKGD